MEKYKVKYSIKKSETSHERVHEKLEELKELVKTNQEKTSEVQTHVFRLFKQQQTQTGSAPLFAFVAKNVAKNAAKSLFSPKATTSFASTAAKSLFSKAPKASFKSIAKAATSLASKRVGSPPNGKTDLFSKAQNAFSNVHQSTDNSKDKPDTKTYELEHEKLRDEIQNIIVGIQITNTKLDGINTFLNSP